MSIYAIADLHLSEATDKPMDIFGSRWQGYTEKIVKNWKAIVKPTDTVIIPGDISWASTLEESTPDFELINSLPGKKIIGKGNHDFWWQTNAKFKKFLKDNNFDTIDLLYNNAHLVEDFIIAGSRGWYIEERLQNTINETNYDKIVSREAGRVRLSLEAAKKLNVNGDKEITLFFHFPPVYKEFICQPIIDVIKEYGIKKCYFGHIHSNYSEPTKFTFDGINFEIISADFLNFIPKLITL